MIKELLNSRMKEYTIGKQKYKVNQLIFETLIVILCLIFITTYFYYGADKQNHFYIKCNQQPNCENPYYHSIDCGTKLPATEKICTQEIFQYQETYGTPPPPIVIYFNLIWIIGLIICFILNHIIYNKDFKYKTLNDTLSESLKEIETLDTPPVNEKESTSKQEPILTTSKIIEEIKQKENNGEVNKMTEGYCMKCKTTRTMKETKEETMSNGRKAIKGKCTECNTGMYKILGK